MNASTMNGSQPFANDDWDDVDGDGRPLYKRPTWLAGAAIVLLLILALILAFRPAPIDPFTVEEGKGLTAYVQDHETAINIGDQFDLGFRAKPLNADALVALPTDLFFRLADAEQASDGSYIIDRELALDLGPHTDSVRVDVPVWPGDYFDPDNDKFVASAQRPGPLTAAR